ncbi:hypothetical protein ABIF78_007659 [Bradyrhizobium japonicum]
MSNMTRLPGVPDTDSLRPGMAHFLGTGPLGSTCGTCRHRGYWYEKPTKNKRTGAKELKSRRTFGCHMYFRLTQRHGDPVDKSWAECKYYAARSSTEARS